MNRMSVWAARFGVGLLLLTCPAALAAPAPTEQVTADGLLEEVQEPLFPGARHLRLARSGPRPLVVHVVELDLGRAPVRWRLSPGDRSEGMEYVAETVRRAAVRHGALVAINASYFLPFAGGSAGADDFYPHEGDPVSASGAVMAAGQVVSPPEHDLDIRVNAMLCFKGRQGRILEGQACPAGFTDGVAAGPLLLEDGRRQSFTAFDNNYAVTAQPRSAIGFSKDGRRAWIVAVDGRQASSVGVSLADLTDIFLRLGAADAINLDGGGSTTLVTTQTPGVPKVLNTPIHSAVPGRERPVANAILLVPEDR